MIARGRCRRGSRSLLLAVFAVMPARAVADTVVDLAPIVVTAPVESADETDASQTAAVLGDEDLRQRRAGALDAASLLQDLPGISLYGAGGISSLPAVHGLGDDRLRVQVDGVDLVSACPNHMNAPLSYVSPSRVARVRTFAGVSPVSVGGDSIGGAIQVTSTPPLFATREERYVAHAEAGSFYRTNGNAYGYNVWASAALPRLSITYAESSSRSDNFVAGGGFKPASAGREGGPALAENVVGSSGFRGATNRSLGIAARRPGHLVQVDVGRQSVDFEGFPNQRMDMTGNTNWVFAARYTGQYRWGDVQARLGYQDTRHKMDMGPDRFSYGTGMPMNSKAKHWGAALQGNVLVSDSSLLRVGAEHQSYTLNDWWPAVGGVMGPNAFWNVDDGRRNRVDGFVEWETRWKDIMGQVGVRGDRVDTDTAAVQGYDNGLAAAWGNDAAAFNSRSHRRSDLNWDATGLLEYSPGPRQSYRAGYSRRSHSPNLYQRYAWSTNAMAALMNNFVGDGNGYVGNGSLRPEVANAATVAGHWHDAASARWDIEATAYYSHVQDYIDARRCDVGQCSAENGSATANFVLLQYVNQSARIFGWDASGRLVLYQGQSAGRLESAGSAAFVRGQNPSTGEDLYNMMPLHARVVLRYLLGPWSASAEVVAVGAKNHVSRVRNEIRTAAYQLLNVRSSLAWKHVQVDAAVENLFDRLYANPLGGAYLGQGPSMTSNGIPWGVVVPGRGRSFSASLTLRY